MTTIPSDNNSIQNNNQGINEKNEISEKNQQNQNEINVNEDKKYSNELQKVKIPDSIVDETQKEEKYMGIENKNDLNNNNENKKEEKKSKNNIIDIKETDFEHNLEENINKNSNDKNTEIRNENKNGSIIILNKEINKSEKEEKQIINQKIDLKEKHNY